MKKLQISKEFKSLIPPLLKGEFDLLEQSILEEGIRDPIVVYNDVIIDGHNRHEIAQKHGLKFETVDKEFSSMDEAVAWIIRNQLGRRNISDFTRYELLVMIVESELLVVGKEKQIRKSINSVLSLNDKTKPYNTQEIVAKKLGWGSTKVVMVKFVKQNANLETLRELRDGKISINKAYKKIKKAQKVSKDKEGKAKIAQLSSIQNTNFTEKVTKKYKERAIKFSLEIDNTITNYMKDNKIVDRGKAINELLSMGINYHYYVKEEI